MKQKKRNRLLALSLCLIMVLGLLPGAALAEQAETGKNFAFFAATSEQVIVEPVQVPYSEGQTLLEALQAAGFSCIMDSGFLTAVNGVSGSFYLYDSDGAYDLAAPADGKTALLVTESDAMNADAVALCIRLAEYKAMTNHVQQYEAAQTAAESALDCLRQAGDFSALLAELNAAIAEYEALQAGSKVTLTVSALQGGTALTKPTITLTDAYGNESSVTGTSLKVVPGSYSFSVSDGGFNRTEGSIEISRGTSLTVTLPSGDWFGSVALTDAAGQAYSLSQDRSAHTLVCSVPDQVGSNGVYLKAEQGAVPDSASTILRTLYTDTDGGDSSEIARSWNSSSTRLSGLLEQGTQGRDFTIEARYTGSDGYLQVQSYQLTVRRLPTLASLTVSEQGANLLADFDGLQTSYQLTTAASSLTLNPVPFSSGCTVQVNGGSSTAVSLKTGENTVKVTVSDGVLTNTYTLTITRDSSVSVTLNLPAATTAVVRNSAGAELRPVSGSTYSLAAGEVYTYTATKNTYYHTMASFTAAKNLTVSVAAPDTGDALTDFAAYNALMASNRKSYSPETAFTSSGHSYDYLISDANSAFYAQATPVSGYTVKACYIKQAVSAAANGVAVETSIPSTKTVGGGSAQVLGGVIAPCGYGNRVTIRLSKTIDGISYYQDYYMNIRRASHIKSLTLKDAAGEELTLQTENGTVTAFDRDVFTYNVSVADSAEFIVLSGELMNELDTTSVCGGYSLTLNGQTVESFSSGLELALNPEEERESALLTVSHADPDNSPATYRLNIIKKAPVSVTLSTEPADARLFVTLASNGKTVKSNNGVFSMTPGFTYTVTVTANGYVGQSLTYTAPEAAADRLKVTLQPAPASSALAEPESAWPSFRPDETNNAVVSAPAPTTAEDAVMYWAVKIGDGYSTASASSPILVDDCLYAYAGTGIYRVDSHTGEVLASGTMDRASSFAIMPPTYADGMIFVGLSNGGVQAFNAETLESLWLYNDPLKGQPNCPITVKDGYLYTGFWLSEVKDANYVCLSISDEDPSQSTEAKLATWSYSSQGGFYWAGCWVGDSFALIPTDDGANDGSGFARVVSIDVTNGELLDVFTLPDSGDIRSTICYDEATDRFYFSTKGGFFYGISVSDDGRIDSSDLIRIQLLTSGGNPGSSTSTPAIYNGRAYVGVTGESQFTPYAGHNITVIDLASRSVAYTVPTMGSVQTGAVVTTAYEEENGSVYVYFFENYTPGKLRVIQDKPGQTAPSGLVTETYEKNGVSSSYQVAPALITPSGAQAQYAIGSPVVDEYGTIYFKNDSSHIMAVGSTISGLEITSQPDKTVYQPGESFDPAGMTVTAAFSNGVTRDVTEYLSWSEQALTEDDADFFLTYEYVMYQDVNGQAGVEYTAPAQILSLTIRTPVPGDVDGDGQLTLLDVSLLYRAVAKNDSLPEEGRANADVTADGRVTLRDVAALFRLCMEQSVGE